MFLLMCYLKCKLSFRYIQYCQSYVWIRKHKEIKEKRNVWSFEKNYLVLHNQGEIQIPRTPDVWQSVKWLSTGHQILSRGMKGRSGLTSAPCTTDWKGQRAHGSAWLTILTKHLEAMAGKKASKKGFNTCCLSQTGKWKWKDKQGMTQWPVCPSHKTNCAHGSLLEGMGVSHSEAIYGLLLHTCIYFDKLNFFMVEETSNDSSIYKY